jgi:hypothetical protein
MLQQPSTPTYPLLLLLHLLLFLLLVRLLLFLFLLLPLLVLHRTLVCLLVLRLWLEKGRQYLA